MLNGRGEWIRTTDPIVPNDVRYQAAPRPDLVFTCAIRTANRKPFRLIARFEGRRYTPERGPPQWRCSVDPARPSMLIFR